jgi:hypothetical protein
MQPKALIFLGFVLAIGCAVLGFAWLPYADSGVREPAHYHFLALGATLLGILLPFLEAARRASCAPDRQGYSATVSGWFLSCSAVLTLGLFAATYHGLGYAVFWSVQVLQYGLLAVVLGFGRQVGRQAGARETDAAVLQRRRDGAIAELQQLALQFGPAAARLPARAALLGAAQAMAEELRYVSTFGIPADAHGSVFGRAARWRLAAESALGAEPAGASDAPGHAQLLAEASAIIRSLAGAKR